MPASATNARTRRSGRSGGFTIVELLAVMIMLVILAGTAVPALTSMGDTRAAMATKHLHRDLTFARQHAIATGTITWVLFDTSGDTGWELEVEDPATPGKASAVALTDPANGGDWAQTLNGGSFAETKVLTASFTGTDTFSVPDIGFDWLGRPFTKDGVALNALGTVTITGGYAVNVHLETGYAEYSAP